MANSEVTPEMLDRVQEQRAAAAARKIELDEAREVWPVNVNALLRALGAKAEEHEARIATLEARLG